NDEDTPEEFVLELMQRVFGKSQREAIAFVAQVDEEARASCGPYPSMVARALMDSAQARIEAAGHRLRITSTPVRDGCELCDAVEASTLISIDGKIVCL